MRILYSSNGFWCGSGYGVQGRSLLPRLAALPQVGGRENLALFAWYGLQGGVSEADGIRILPAGMDHYGNDVIGAHAHSFGADLVVTLIDAWVMQDVARKVAPARWCPWIPIDHEPIPQRVLDGLAGAHEVLAFSWHGYELLQRAGVRSRYMPLGLEPTTFRVLVGEMVTAFRRQMFGDATHVTVMVAANKGYPDRKAFQVQLRGWREFAEDVPGARLYIHTEPTTAYGGLDLEALTKSLSIADRVIFPDRYQYFLGLPANTMAFLYNAADVLLGASMGEGFGIPLIEAQACGTPVITTDFTSMPELVVWGRAVAPLDHFWTALNSWQAWPDWRGIADSLRFFYESQQMYGGVWPLDHRLRISRQVHEQFGWDVLVDAYWAPWLQEMAG